MLPNNPNPWESVWKHHHAFAGDPALQKILSANGAGILLSTDGRSG